VSAAALAYVAPRLVLHACGADGSGVAFWPAIEERFAQTWVLMEQ
jgi:hypothetical protein